MITKQPLIGPFQAFCAGAASDLLVVAPYIRRDALLQLLDRVTATAVTVLTTWKLPDLVGGASDLEVFPLMRGRSGFVYLHQRLHAKLLVADWSDVIVTSANVTPSGLGLAESFNVECAAAPTPLALTDELWLRSLLAEAILVQPALYDLYKSRLASIATPPITYEELDLQEPSRERDFLLSSLPMSDRPDVLLDLGALPADRSANHTRDEWSAAMHDIALYNLRLSSNREQMRQQLRVAFFAHPFVRAFVAQCADRIFFGEAKAWVQRNCTDVPVPRRRTLTGHVRVLFDWVEALGEGTFEIQRPNYSECLVRRG